MFWNVRATPLPQDPMRRQAQQILRRRSGSLPPSAGVSPVMALNNVDLPDPFGPITATTPPAGTVRSTAFSATSPP